VRDPLGDGTGAWLYKTGLAARMLPNGGIERVGPARPPPVREPRSTAAAQAQGMAAPPAPLSSAASTIPRAPRNVDLPLSFEQQRMWILQQFEPQGVAYNNSFALRLDGTLDMVAFEQSLMEIVHRHEALRTVFPDHDGVPVQVVPCMSRRSARIYAP